MRVHLNGVASDVHELWGGGPQGGLLTVLLFNFYSNWITDICQPGTNQSDRFTSDARIAAPRCSAAQLRDCPLDFCSGPRHFCSHVNPCTTWSNEGSNSPQTRSSNISSYLVQLNPDAAVFFPAPPPPTLRLDPLAQVFLPKKAGTDDAHSSKKCPMFDTVPKNTSTTVLD